MELQVAPGAEGALRLFRDGTASWDLVRPDLTFEIERALAIHDEDATVAPSGRTPASLVLRTAPGVSALELHGRTLKLVGSHDAWVRLPNYWLDTPPEWAGDEQHEVTDRRTVLPVRVANVVLEPSPTGGLAAAELPSKVQRFRLDEQDVLYGLRTPHMPSGRSDQRGLEIASGDAAQASFRVADRHAVAALDRAYLSESTEGSSSRAREMIQVVERGQSPGVHPWQDLPKLGLPLPVRAPRRLHRASQQDSFRVAEPDELAPALVWREGMGELTVSSLLHDRCDAIGPIERSSVDGSTLWVLLRGLTWLQVSPSGELRGRVWLDARFGNGDWTDEVHGFEVNVTGVPWNATSHPVPVRALVGPTSASRWVDVSAAAQLDFGAEPRLSIEPSVSGLGLSRNPEGVVSLEESIDLAGGASLLLRTKLGSKPEATHLSLSSPKQRIPLPGASVRTIGHRVFVVWGGEQELGLTLEPGIEATRLNRLFVELRRSSSGLHVYSGIIGWEGGPLGNAEPVGTCHITEQFFEGSRRVVANGQWRFEGNDFKVQVSLDQTVLTAREQEGGRGARVELVVQNYEAGTLSFASNVHFRWSEDGHFRVGAEALLFERGVHGTTRVGLRMHDLLRRPARLDADARPGAFCQFSLRSDAVKDVELNFKRVATIPSVGVEWVDEANPTPPEGANQVIQVIYNELPDAAVVAVRVARRWLMTGLVGLLARAQPDGARLLLLSRRYGLGSIQLTGESDALAREQLRHVGWRREAILEHVTDGKTTWKLVDSPLEHDDLGFDWLSAASEGPAPQAPSERVRAQELVGSVTVVPRATRRDGQTSVVEGTLVIADHSFQSKADTPLTLRWTADVPFEIGSPPAAAAPTLAGATSDVTHATSDVTHLAVREVTFALAAHRPGELIDTRFEMGHAWLEHTTDTIRCRAPRADDDRALMALKLEPSRGEGATGVVATATESSVSTTLQGDTSRFFLNGPGGSQLPLASPFELCVFVPSGTSVIGLELDGGELLIDGKSTMAAWSKELAAENEPVLHRFAVEARGAKSLRVSHDGVETKYAFTQQPDRATLVGLLRGELLIAYGPARSTWSGALVTGANPAFAWSRSLRVQDPFGAPSGTPYTLFRMRGDGSMRVSRTVTLT